MAACALLLAALLGTGCSDRPDWIGLCHRRCAAAGYYVKAVIGARCYCDLTARDLGADGGAR